MDLLDLNLLLSLAWRNHVHHAAARSWFRRRRRAAWATTPFTEAGFVRLSANPSMTSEAVTPAEALALLARLREVAGHRFLPDDLPMVLGEYVEGTRVATHRQVTDAHLLALARRHGARLATFDRAVGRLAGGDDVVLVPFS